ncbi:MAG: ATP-binding protein [Peptostreptococcaceae bacterium]
MKKKLKFEYKIILSSIIIAFIPLILSYIIFINDRLENIDETIKLNLKEAGFIVSQTKDVQEKLYKRENDFTIQAYTSKLITNLNDVDIIVIADMTGRKYSHLDVSQIGKNYVGEDKDVVLKEGKSYYSVMEGSQGVTLRWFEPIKYKNKQVGFVMVGKYYEDITVINKETKARYYLLFICTLSISIIASSLFGKSVKKEILNMEPYEIATLYNKKKIIINSVHDGIIALNKNNEVTEINVSCYKLFDNFSIDEVMKKLNKYINDKQAFKMKEFIIQDKKVFVTIQPIIQSSEYQGMVITLTPKEDISKLAKEITGVDEVIKNLRANIHEFRNNLHVILGLIQIEEYEEVKHYIQNIQKIQETNTSKFNSIEDSYIKALLLSRELVAKERKVEFVLTEESFLHKEHKFIDSYDLITIVGNLIENALDACSATDEKDKKVEVSLYENEKEIKIRVKDNGEPIDKDIKERIFKEGTSSKGRERGIGLNLVKNRVELYNGSINIEEFNNLKIFNVIIFKGE